MSLARSAAGMACLVAGIVLGVWLGHDYIGLQSPTMLFGVLLGGAPMLVGLVAAIVILTGGKDPDA